MRGAPDHSKEWTSEIGWGGSQQRMCERAGCHSGQWGLGWSTQRASRRWCRTDFTMVPLRVEEAGVLIHQPLPLIPMTFGSNSPDVRPDQCKCQKMPSSRRIQGLGRGRAVHLHGGDLSRGQDRARIASAVAPTFENHMGMHEGALALQGAAVSTTPCHLLPEVNSQMFVCWLWS